MFASLQLLNAPLNHHFRQQQQQHLGEQQQDPFQFNPTVFPFFTPQQPFIPQPVKSEDSPELCLAPGLLYHEDTSSGSSCGSSSPSEEPSTPPPSSSHAQIIPQKRRSPSTSVINSSPEPGSTASSSSSSSTVSSTSASSTGPAVTKPKRAAPATRISSKDFVPPDVTGLSKREARLVKNRAAAFLSRQRKREEFEALEVRAAELEAENAQLRAGNPNAHLIVQDSSLQAEIDRLNAELDTANRRADLLESDLARLRAVQAETQQQLHDLSSPTTSNNSVPESESDVPSSSVSSSGDSDTSSDEMGLGQKELTPKNLIMALLMLLSPVLSHDSQKSFKPTSHPHPSPPTSQLPTPVTPYEIFPSQMTSNFIPNTPFEQFLKPDPLSTFEPSSFYTTTDLDMNGDLHFNMGNTVVQQPGFVGTSSSPSYEASGYGEMDLLKSPVEITHMNNALLSESITTQAIELDVELHYDPQDANKVRVRIVADPISRTTSTSTSSLTHHLPQDFINFPPSPTVPNLDGVTYSFSSSSRNSERKRVRISLDPVTQGQGWSIHVEECC